MEVFIVLYDEESMMVFDNLLSAQKFQKRLLDSYLNDGKSHFGVDIKTCVVNK